MLGYCVFTDLQSIDANKEEENEEDLTEEQKMMKLMGFGGFDTTKVMFSYVSYVKPGCN
jgi:hypothetical protein